MTTALEITKQMDLSHEARLALELDVHPQDRTRYFHQAFDAPIRDLIDEKPDATFSHMDDERVAFRASFIISEIFELLEKGLGLNIKFSAQAGKSPTAFAYGSDNAQLAKAILIAMQGSNKRDLIEVVDALGDLNVVVNGFAVELGVDMRAVDREILASNLTKLGEDGKPIVADGSDPQYPAGKILKGPNFVEPQLSETLGL